MNRTNCWLFALFMSCAVIRADVIHMKDGSKKEGKIVARKDGVVVLQVTVGSLSASLRIPEKDIERIEEKPSPIDAYEERKAKIKADDPEAHYKLGLWAEQNSLPDKAKTAFQQALKLKPDHAGAAQKLDYVLLEGKWTKKEDALKRLEGQYKAGDFKPVYEMLHPLKNIPNGAMRVDIRTDALMLYAKSCERLSKWEEAVEAWRRVRQVARNRADRSISSARAQILEQYPDGRFSCSEDKLPPALSKFDPASASLAKEAKAKSLADESVMSLAMKVQAFTMLDQAKKDAARVVDRSPASEKAFKAAASNAAAADQILAGVGKEVRVKVLKAILAFHCGVLADVARELDSKITVSPGNAYPGTQADAKKSAEISKKLLGEYEATVEYLAGLEKDLPEELAKLKEGLEKEKKRYYWLTSQGNALQIREQCKALEVEYLGAMNSAKACDPRTQQYPVNRYEGNFVDGGKMWRKHTSASVRHARKANSILKKMLKEYQKNSEAFAAEIEQTEQRTNECDAFIKGVAALGNRKGVTKRGWYPW